MTDVSVTSRLYLDSNVFIYALEGAPDVATKLQVLFDIFQARAGSAVTSELALAEILPKAADWQRRYYLDLIIWRQIFELRPVSRDVLLETASYRRAARVEGAGMPKLPDAIHVVTAMQSGCFRILSGDRRLCVPAGYSVIYPDFDGISRLIQELG
jgi:predicted nucleic acid-binding protein